MSIRPLQEALDHNLVGCTVVCSGTVGDVIDYNPYGKFKSQSRNWRILVLDVTVGNVRVDHVILHGCKAVRHLKDGNKKGEKMSFTAKVKPYTYLGQSRWGLSFPYKIL